MTEKTIPILPCRSIDEILTFYESLGFAVTYRQERPNTFAIVERGAIELQFFVLKALEPADNWSTCYVLVSDVDTLYEAFTDGLRRSLGKLPSRGIPRINALRDMSYGVRQFIVVDPGGNYIRIGQPITAVPAPRAGEASRLERALGAAVLLADSKFDAPAAVKVLETAMAADEPAPAAVRVQALILRADLAVRMDEPERGRTFLADARAIELSANDRDAIADDLDRAADLEDVLSGG